MIEEELIFILKTDNIILDKIFNFYYLIIVSLISITLEIYNVISGLYMLVYELFNIFIINITKYGFTEKYFNLALKFVETLYFKSYYFIINLNLKLILSSHCLIGIFTFILINLLDKFYKKASNKQINLNDLDYSNYNYTLVNEEEQEQEEQIKDQNNLNNLNLIQLEIETNNDFLVKNNELIRNINDTSQYLKQYITTQELNQFVNNNIELFKNLLLLDLNLDDQEVNELKEIIGVKLTEREIRHLIRTINKIINNRII